MILLLQANRPFLMRIIYALFLVFFSTDIINGIKNLRGIINISIFSFLIFLILSSLIYLISVKNYPYENFYNMLIITSIFLVFYKNENDYILKFVIFSVLFSSLYSIVRPDTISEWTFRKTGGTGDPNEFACHLILGFILTWNHINNRSLKVVLFTLFSFTSILSVSITGGLCFFQCLFIRFFLYLKTN